MKLKNAYVSLERELQLEEKKLLALKQKEEEERIFAEMEKERHSIIQKLADMERERKLRNEHAKQVLQEQIALREKSKEEEYAEFLREKAMVDEIVRKEEEREQT
jgi:hypothetical protein